MFIVFLNLFWGFNVSIEICFGYALGWTPRRTGFWHGRSEVFVYSNFSHRSLMSACQAASANYRAQLQRYRVAGVQMLNVIAMCWTTTFEKSGGTSQSLELGCELQSFQYFWAFLTAWGYVASCRFAAIKRRQLNSRPPREASIMFLGVRSVFRSYNTSFLLFSWIDFICYSCNTALHLVTLCAELTSDMLVFKFSCIPNFSHRSSMSAWKAVSVNRELQLHKYRIAAAQRLHIIVVCWTTQLTNIGGTSQSPLLGCELQIVVILRHFSKH